MNDSRTIQAGISAAMICGILVLGGSQTAAAVGDNDRPVAIIGNIKVTEKEFKAEMERGGYGLSGRFEQPEQREALLEDMIRSEVLYATAIKDGYDRRPAILDAVKRIIINKYRQDHLEPELSIITVTEEEIQGFYKEHTSEFSTPQMVRAAVIKISVAAKVSDEKRAELLKRAEDARTEALTLDRAVPSFSAVAVKYSDDQVSRYRGGDTGIMKRGAADARWSKEVMDAIFSLSEPGQVSPVIVSSDGYYLVKLMERQQSAARPLKEVNEIIRYKLFFEKRSAAEKAFYDRLASTVKVNVNGELLNAIGPPAGGKRLEPPALPGK